jgi:AhpD family alkylhydroperoxidase
MAPLQVGRLAPRLDDAISALNDAPRTTSMEPRLLELVRLRASQLSGCSYCVNLHSRDARMGGESEKRLDALPIWRETPFFTLRERAALDLTEAGTTLTDGPVTDEVFARATEQFTETELAELIWAIAIVNACPDSLP